MSERLNRYLHSETESYGSVEEYERDEDIERYPEEKLFARLVDDFGLKELLKNKLEQKIGNALIAATRSVLENLRLGNIGKRIEINESNIHIINEEEAGIIYPDNSADGWHNVSGVYILRTQDRVQFTRVLSHELSHYISYRRDSFKYDDQADRPKFKTHKTGLASFEEDRENFYGLMEATTELLAIEIRKKFIETESIFNLQEENTLKLGRAYVAQVRLLKRVIRDVASTNKEYEEVQQELFKDHVVGTVNFLNRLKDKLPKAYGLLRDMGTDPAEVVLIARELGYAEIAEEVEKELDAIDSAEEKDANKMVRDLVNRFKAEFPQDYQLIKTGDFEKSFKLIWGKKKDRWAIHELKKMGYEIPGSVDRYDFQRLRIFIADVLERGFDKNE